MTNTQTNTDQDNWK